MNNNKKKKNDEKFNQNEFLTKVKIPQENVIDLKKLLIQEEKGEKKSGFSFKKIFPYSQKKSAAKNRFKKKKGLLWEIRWSNLIVFACICLVLIIPFLFLLGLKSIDQVKGKVLGASVIALENLKSAGLAISEFDINEAKDKFKNAEEGFLAAQEELNKINNLLLNLIKIVPFKGSTISSGEHLIQAGKLVAEIGGIISEKIEPLTSLKLSFKEDTLNVSDVLVTLEESLDTVAIKLEQTKEHLEKVKVKSLPRDYQEEVAKAKAILPSLDSYFQYLRKIFKVTSRLLGTDEIKEYLFIFQNNHELRPTGGFIGSLALVNVEKGRVRILEVPPRGPYEINDDLELEIIPPKPLWLINNKWQIQDANWFPDFPTSARKINWFYENSRGFAVDGVISFTPEVIVDLLEVTGPITLDKFETTLTNENFIEETQKKVEFEYEKEVNKPKQIIDDLIPILLNKVLQTKAKDFIQVLSIFQKAFQEKYILIYVADKELEKKINELDLGGEIRKTEKDYLMVVNTNIGGGKTDGVISEKIFHQAEIFPDGTIIDTVKIKRTHQGDPEDIFTKIKNMDYLRLYVPNGSELIEAEGFDEIYKNLLLHPSKEAQQDSDLLAIEKDPVIHERSNTRVTQEFGKTVFANWINLEVGESKEVIIKYKLPFKISDQNDIYSLYIQKQPGAKAADIEAELKIPKNYVILEQVPQGLNIDSSVIQYTDSLNKDKAYGVILEKK